MSNAILPDGKVCNTCSLLLPISNYHKNKSSKGGHLPRCKACRKVADASYIETHREQGRLRARVWAKSNKEKAHRKAREWAIDNPERVKAIQYKHRHSDHGKAAAKLQIAARDPARRSLVAQRYYRKNKVKYRTYTRNRRARVRSARDTHSADDIQRLLVLQRGKCANCRKPLAHNYEADHRMPLALGGSNGAGNMELLCRRCNRSKGAKLPHIFAQENGRLI